MQSDTSAKGIPALWCRAHYNCYFDCLWPFYLYPLPHQNQLNISSHIKPFIREDLNAEGHRDDPSNRQVCLVL